MVTNQQLVELLQLHVLHPSEQIERVREWPNELGVVVYTSGRDFAVELDAKALISQADWVNAVVVASREDVEAEGLPETDGILVLADGGSISLNDASSVADLGRGLGRNLELEAFAEILVRWHPPSTAPQFVVRDSEHVRRAFGRSDLPSFDAPAGGLLGNRYQGRFFSARRRAVALGGA